MSSRALAGIAGALLVVVSVFALLRAGERAVPAAAAPEQAALIEELRALRLAQERTLAALERMTQELALRASAAPAPARQNAGDGAPSGELVAALDALRETLEERAFCAAPAPLRSLAQDGESLDVVRRRVGSLGWSTWLPFLERWHADDDAATRSLQLRTMREILAEFGEPNEVTWFPHAGTVTFIYTEPVPPDGGREASFVHVTFYDGIVVRVEARQVE